MSNPGPLRPYRKDGTPAKPHRMPPGRKKGTPNRITLDLKIAILNAFTKLGGEDYLVVLGRRNPTVFGTLLGKVLPLTVNASLDVTTHEAALKELA